MNCNVGGIFAAITKRFSFLLSAFLFILPALVPEFSPANNNAAKGAEAPSRILLLAFTSEGCPACRALEPLISSLERKNYPIQRIAPDKSGSNTYDKFGITTMPSFVLLVDGTEQERFISQGEDIQFVQARLLTMFQNGSSKLAAAKQAQEDKKNPEQAEAVSSLGEMASPSANQPRSRPENENNSFHSPASAKALASTVRLKIAGNSNETESGTGTLIHTNNNGTSSEGLILTCGHLFRESEGKLPVLVDIFQTESGKSSTVTVTGECVFYDDDLDIGFVGIPLPFPMEPACLVPQNYVPKAGDKLFSVGCSAGNSPSIWDHIIRSTDQKFYQPRDPQSKNQNFYFIEVTNAPEPGRSGGGLFVESSDGQPYLVGVCNAGDPRVDEGFFLPFSVVYEQLYANSNLAFVYQEILKSQTANSGKEKIQPVSFDSPPAQSPASQEKIRQPNYEKNNNEVLQDGKEAKLQEIRRLLDQGAEVFCIINWPQNPSGREKESEMIKISSEK